MNREGTKIPPQKVCPQILMCDSEFADTHLHDMKGIIKLDSTIKI